MKKLFLFLFIFIGSLSANEPTSVLDQDEIKMLEDLVESTKSKLASQEFLLQLMKEFKQYRSDFIANPTSRKLATGLVRSAKKIEQEIQNNHISHLFSESFLKEIHFFSDVARQASSQNITAPS